MIINYEKFLLENLSDREQLLKRLEVYDMDPNSYDIDKDNIVDCYQNVFLCFFDLDEIPFVFGKVELDFDCYENSITTLTGSPRKVGFSFNCSKNQLRNLKGSPDEIGLNFICKDNLLISLEGCTKIVPGNFDCSENKLKDLTNGPIYVGGDYICSFNDLSIEGYPYNCTIKGKLRTSSLLYKQLYELIENHPESFDQLRNDKVKFHHQIMRMKPDFIEYYNTIKPPSNKTFI